MTEPQWRAGRRRRLEASLDLVLPRECAGCQRPGSRWCRRCDCRLAQLRPHLAQPPDGVGVLGVVGSHAGQLAGAVVAHKRPASPAALTRALWAGFLRALAVVVDVLRSLGRWRAPVLVTAIPTSAGNRARSPMASLAGPLRGHAGLFPSDVLIQTRRRRPQKELGGRDRLANMHHALRVNPAGVPAGITRAVVVDDVVTTGASLSEAVRALRAGGVAPIGAVALSLADGTAGPG